MGPTTPSGPVFPTGTDCPTGPGRNSWETGNPRVGRLGARARMRLVERTVAAPRRILASSPLIEPPRTAKPDDSLPTRGPVVRVQPPPDADAAESLRRLPSDRCRPPGSGRAGDARGRLPLEPVPRRRDANLPAGARGVRLRGKAVRRVPRIARTARPACARGPGDQSRAGRRPAH